MNGDMLPMATGFGFVLNAVAVGAVLFAVWSAGVWVRTPRAERHWFGLLPTIGAVLLALSMVSPY